MRHPFLRTLAGSAAPAATDPNFENVTLLLHGDGTNGGQNNTFVDGSTNNFTITRNGNTTQGTFSPYGDNWSNYFDGTGDYLSRAFTSTTDGMYPQGTTYTIEAWFYASLTTSVRIIYDCSASNVTNFGGVWLGMNAGAAQFNCRPTTGGTLTSISGGSIVTNSWNHIAISVNAGSGRLFLNGTQVGSTTTISACSFTPVGASIGRLSNGYTVGIPDYAGYISNVRLVQSTALYTANFTPPTAPLLAITNTSLLTCQSNRVRDTSTNNFTITRNGDVSVQRFSPFSPTAAYAAGTIGGSGYFDGTGDYLTAPDNAAFDFGTGDFTIELWVYIAGNSSLNSNSVREATVVTSFPTTIQTLTNSWGLNISGNGTTTGTGISFSNWQSGSNSLLSATVTVPQSSWNHIAVARSGTTTKLFLNGAEVASGTLSLQTIDSGQAIAIGRLGYPGYIQELNGYISNVRVLKGTALYTGSYSIPTAPLTAITNTSLLLNFTNAAILDNAMMAVPETVGNAQIDTTTKKFGTGSLEFDGTGDWLLVPDSIDQRLGTGNFTIECWLYLSATGAARGIVGKGTSTTGWLLSTNASNNVVFTYGTSTITSTGTLSGTTWYHIAVVREGTGTNQTKIYIGGTNDGTGTVSTDFTQTNAAYVGANRTGGDALNGYLDDVRITKGVARYTSNFTPPTAAFPDL